MTCFCIVDQMLQCLRPGDLIIGSLITKLSTGYLMKVFCSDGDSCRVVLDLGLKVSGRCEKINK